MSPSPDSLYQQFIDDFRANPAADPLEYLRRAQPDERVALAHRIDAYLSEAPLRPIEQMPTDDPATEAVVDALMRSLVGNAGMWPSLLPRLRRSARIRRAELVDRLADALGVSGRRAKVADYYHQMELGVLPPEGVSDRVLDALATILDSTRERLREAGGSLSELAAPSVETVFMRTHDGEPAPAAAPEPEPAEEFDEVDELFRGGH